MHRGLLGTAILAAACAAAAGCEVGDRGLCLDLTANRVDRGSGCVALHAQNVPADRCAPCPDQQCGVDFACESSSCVLAPNGDVFLVFCLDARQRSWPAGWRPLAPSEIPTSAALTQAQRATCLSTHPWDALCVPKAP